MSGSRYVVPYAYAYQPTGEPIPGALLNFFETGSDTIRADTYSNPTLTTPNANPVPADASGTFPSIFLDPSVTYRVRLTYPINTLTGLADEVWTADPVASPDAGAVTFSQANTYPAGTVGAHLKDWNDVKDAPYNAKGDGVADDHAAFTAADVSGRSTWVPKGTYLIGSSISLNNALNFDQGAILQIPDGVTVTMNGMIEAGVWQIFQCTGTGKVVISPIFNREGYPEWWGCIANDSSGGVSALNAAAINAAIVAVGTVTFQATDYYISATIKDNQGNSWLNGAGGKYDSVKGLRGTRIVITDGTSDVVQLGPDTDPGSFDNYARNIRMTGIYATRSVAPSVPSACAAVRVKYVLQACLEDVTGAESIRGIEFFGTVRTSAVNCDGLRQAAGTGGTDVFRGLYANGSSGIGAGGNASLYWIDCNVNDTRVVKTGSIGFVADVKFSDNFWINCESKDCEVGMEVAGDGSGVNNSGNIDLKIINPTNDTFSKYGIYLHDFGISGTAEVTTPYCGPKFGAITSLYILRCAGAAITVTGGQLEQGSAGNCNGIALDTVAGVAIIGTICGETETVPAVYMKDAVRCRIMPTVLNQTKTGGAAVQINGNAEANIIEPMVTGKASGVTFGIQVVGAGDNRNEYRLTGIDSNVVAGGANNKLVRNGTPGPWTPFTLTGTNAVSGVTT